MSNRGSGVQNKISDSQVHTGQDSLDLRPMSHILTTAPVNKNISQCINFLHFNYYSKQGCHLVTSVHLLLTAIYENSTLPFLRTKEDILNISSLNQTFLYLKIALPKIQETTMDFNNI